MEYGNGTSATYGYDAVGQVLSIVYGNTAGEVLSAFGYGYDQAGNPEHKAFADGAKESYGYDGLNRLTSADYPAGRRVDYGYDAVGNRLSMSDSTASGTRWATTASAASQYYPASLAIGPPDAGAGCSNDHSWWPWYSSSATSSMLAVGYARAERARGLRVHETVAGGFVTRIDLVDDKGISHTIHEGGDGTACGGWLSVKFPLTDYKVAQAKVYTAAIGPIGIDAVGLDVVATQTYEYNGFDQLTSVASSDGSAATTFGYDGNGNQVRKTDASGITQYVYNQDNRLAGIALANGGSNAFEYDANGLRTKKTDSSGTTSYLLDGMSVIAQYAPDGARQAWYTQSLARIDEVLSVVNGQGKYWYQADALGSTYALADNSGNVTARGGYDVFGAAVAVTGSVGQPFGFTGREHDLDSGLVYARARYLQPSIGRWDRADPLGFVDGPNDYTYVRNRVTHAVDPLGQFATWTHNYIIRQAVRHFPELADDEAALEAASAEADSSQYQTPDNSYRHGMTARNQSVPAAIDQWVDFMDVSLAVAAANYSCPGEWHSVAALHLGFGLHAAADVESPVHQFQVWPMNVLGHMSVEGDIVNSDVEVQNAITASIYYLDAFMAMRRQAGRFGGLNDMQAWAMVYYGWNARLRAYDLVLRR